MTRKKSIQTVSHQTAAPKATDVDVVTVTTCSTGGGVGAYGADGRVNSGQAERSSRAQTAAIRIHIREGRALEAAEQIHVNEGLEAACGWSIAQRSGILGYDDAVNERRTWAEFVQTWTGLDLEALLQALYDYDLTAFAKTTFTDLCMRTLDEIKRLKDPNDIDALTRVQEAMLRFMLARVREDGFRRRPPEMQRRLRDAITKLEKELGVDAQTVVTDWAMRHEDYFRQTRESQPNPQGKPNIPLPVEFQPNVLEMHDGDYPPFDNDRITDYVQAWHEREPDKFREYYEDLEKTNTHQYTQRELKFRTLVLEVMRSVSATAQCKSMPPQAQAPVEKGKPGRKPKDDKFEEMHSYLKGGGKLTKAKWERKWGYKSMKSCIQSYRNMCETHHENPAI